MEQQEKMKQAASLMGKKSWEKRKEKHNSDYFREMAKKRWDKEKKLSTDT